jgi:hypothetical protein
MATYQDYLAQGMSPNQAALQAQMQGGSPSAQVMGQRAGRGPLPPSVAPSRSGLTGGPALDMPVAGPGQVMHGNQPGVATSTPDPGTMKILDRHPSERAAGEAAFRGVYGRDPIATDYEQWKDPFPGVPQSSGGTGNLAGFRDTGSGPATGAVPQQFGQMPSDWVGQKPTGPLSQSGSAPLEGFDGGKLGNKEHNTPKYQIGRVISNFDPKAGVTPELLAELNKLGIGTFEKVSGDKVRVTGNVDPRFEGYTTIDLVRGFNGPGGGQAWQYGADNGAGGAGGGAPAMAGGMGGGGGLAGAAGAGVSSLLSGDPLQRIQQAIGQINGQGQVNLDALLRQLQGV